MEQAQRSFRRTRHRGFFNGRREGASDFGTILGMSRSFLLETSDQAYQIRTRAPGPSGALPLTDELLRHSPSGNLFGLTQNVGMGWDPKSVGSGDVLILSTLGGIRADDGTPLALGMHTGHWELGLLVREAARELKKGGQVPFSVYCSDPCDGRTQGTAGMMDSLPYRNTACEAFGRLIRSLPTRRALMGIATCDKGLPAMMMALAEAREMPGILVPGGVTLPPSDGEDAGSVQSLGSRYSHGEITLNEAAELGCRACASSGGGCQFLGTAATSQVIGEALGLSLPHSALAPSGEHVWLEMARNSAQALMNLQKRGIKLLDILTEGAFRNALAVHAAFGGSTNLLLHVPAIAYCARIKRPTVQDWIDVNRKVSRIVDVLPNGPKFFKTVQVFLAGAVPEVMLHLREMGVLELDCMTVTGMTLRENLKWWEGSERRTRFREILKRADDVNPTDVIVTPDRGFGGTLIFPRGNLAPEGSVVKATAIDPGLWRDNVYEHVGPARVFVNEDAAIEAVKSTGPDRINSGEVMVLLCRGPIGAGMPETAQITISLKLTKALKNTPLLTDGRFSGFSSGPCVGHIGPEALAGGPIGKVRDGDVLRIRLNRSKLEGSIDLVDETLLSQRQLRDDLRSDPNLPNATRLWAALQQTGGGTWGGCVYDVEMISAALQRAVPSPPGRGSG
jgi:putative YjhG/YagF family dehydratase